ncbi:MAG: cytochrome c oxidase subunit II [Haloarculaceae archaeon]
MEIHRFEKVWLALSLVLIVAFVGTITYGTINEGIQMVDASGGTVNPDDLPAAFDDPGVEKVGPGEYEVYVVANRFAFNPGTANPIRVPVGSTVTFYVTSGDVVHGFNLAGTNLNTMVIPGQVAELTTQFDERGTYGIVCHEYCGSGHHRMEGTLQVVPRSQFNATEGTA